MLQTTWIPRERAIADCAKRLNSDKEYELYTKAGNQLAHELVITLASEILQEQITRSAAIKRVTEITARIREIDEGMCDAEPLYNIWGRINRAFMVVGWMPYEP